MALIRITDWCWLLIDAEKLRDLSLEDADDIGRAISATLTDPRIKKEDRPLLHCFQNTSTMESMAL